MCDAELLFIGTEEENFRVSVAIPIGHGNITHARERGKGMRRRQRTVRLLKIERKLAALGLGHKQVGKTIAIHVAPRNAATGFVSAIKGKHLELALTKIIGQHRRGLLYEARNLRTARVQRDADDLRAGIGREIIGDVGADGWEIE